MSPGKLGAAGPALCHDNFIRSDRGLGTPSKFTIRSCKTRQLPKNVYTPCIILLRKTPSPRSSVFGGSLAPAVGPRGLAEVRSPMHALSVFGAMCVRKISKPWGGQRIVCVAGAGHRTLFHPCGRRNTLFTSFFRRAQYLVKKNRKSRSVRGSLFLCLVMICLASASDASGSFFVAYAMFLQTSTKKCPKPSLSVFYMFNSSTLTFRGARSTWSSLSNVCSSCNPFVPLNCACRIRLSCSRSGKVLILITLAQPSCHFRCGARCACFDIARATILSFCAP